MLSLLLMLGSRALLSTMVRADSNDDDDDDVTVENEQPSKEQILAAIQAMKDLSDDDKRKLMESIISGEQPGSGAGAPLGDDMLDGEGNRHLATSLFASQFFMLVAMLSIIALIFVFFGYKLYKSLSERERKREEKKKSKQMKKKK